MVKNKSQAKAKSNKKNYESMKKSLIDKQTATVKKRGMLRSIMIFFDETKAELKKVTWLGRKQVSAYVTIVLIITVAVTLYVSVADYIIAALFRYLGYIFS